MAKQWKLATPAPDDLIFGLLDIPPFIVQTLYNRGLRTAADITRFLAPGDTTTLSDPFALKDMDAAVARIHRAIVMGEQVAVYGDFDVDGVCSAALLMTVLQGLGARAQVYIPHRVEEGYGLNRAAIGRLNERGVRLLITADCGTSSIDDIAYACSLHMDVIVTDHHHVHHDLPPALAVLNPHRPDSVYPFRDLAGVGVAYKLAQALLTTSPGALSDAQFLDLVALGTVVDVAPLLGENRILVQLGLQAMRQAARPGLQALMSVARLAPEAVDAGSLGFILGPRLNAAGRVDSARVSYDLLLSTSPEQARDLAAVLEQQNQERQKLLEEALLSARQQVATQAASDVLIFVADETYAAGIVGLVAGRLAEEFYRPAIAVERGPELSRGSCRSIPEFHIARALDECHDLLERHGGHAQAAGFTVRTDRLTDLQQRLLCIARRDLGERPPEPLLMIDSVIPLSQATWQTVRWLQRLEPCGPGNPAPVFRSDNVLLRAVRQTGNGHLLLKVTDGHVTWDAIGFRQGEWISNLTAGDRVDLVYAIEGRQWAGEQSIQLVIKDLRKR